MFCLNDNMKVVGWRTNDDSRSSNVLATINDIDYCKFVISVLFWSTLGLEKEFQETIRSGNVVDSKDRRHNDIALTPTKPGRDLSCCGMARFRLVAINEMFVNAVVHIL